MPLTLRHLNTETPRSSRFNRPRPVRFADNRLGFVLAPVYPGWFVIPLLGPNPALMLNGRPVSETTRLAFGDRLDLGAKRFAVETCTSSDEANGPLLAATATVLVRCGNQTLAQKRLARPGVVGSDARVAVAVPAEARLAPEHAVVAHVVDRWHLFVLEGPGAYRLGDAPANTLALVPGESVWLTDRVEITLNCEALDPLDLLARTAGEPVRAPVLAPGSGLAVRESAALTRAGEETPASLSLDRDSVRQAAQRSGADPGAAVRRSAAELCGKLQSLSIWRDPVAARAVAAAPFLSLSEPGGTGAEVERLAAALGADPRDPDALFALAGLLRRLRLGELCSWVLSVLHRQNPDDPIVNQSFGAHCREQAADPALPSAARGALLDRARRHLVAARAARGTDPELESLLQQVGADPVAAQPS